MLLRDNERSTHVKRYSKKLQAISELWLVILLLMSGEKRRGVLEERVFSFGGEVRDFLGQRLTWRASKNGFLFWL